VTDIPWTLPQSCESSSCPRWRILPDGSLEIGSTDDDSTKVLSRRDALMFVDAARRGEVMGHGGLIVGASR